MPVSRTSKKSPQPTLSWKVTPDDALIIRKLAERIKALVDKKAMNWSIMDINMDITACHANGCKLDLQRLLDADDTNLMHDIFGINRYIDRKTGKLMNQFLPRFKLKGKTA